MFDTIKKYWSDLSPRDRQILTLAAPIIIAILFWSVIYQPMKDQVQAYKAELPQKRIDLAWMRKQLQTYTNDSASADSGSAGQSESIIAVLEKTAQSSGMKPSIQSLSPGTNKNEARLLLNNADFNRWLKWSDLLLKEHQVKVKRLTVQKEDAANIAEIRVTFER